MISLSALRSYRCGTANTRPQNRFRRFDQRRFDRWLFRLTRIGPLVRAIFGAAGPRPFGGEVVNMVLATDFLSDSISNDR
jgi:hypothetical protein